MHARRMTFGSATSSASGVVVGACMHAREEHAWLRSKFSDRPIFV